MPQMPFFLPLPPPLCYNDIVGTAEKPAFSCPDPQPIRYRENRRWSVPGPVVRNSGPRGIFPPNPSQNQKGPPHNPAGPVFIPSSPPGRHPAPAHLCRSAGLRPAGQTVLRTVLGGGLRPPPTAAPGAAGPAGLLSALPCRPPAPPRQRARRITRQAPFLPHPHRPNGTAARSASTNCASAGLAVSCRQTAMTSSFSSAPVSGMNTRFSAGEYLRAE